MLWIKMLLIIKDKEKYYNLALFIHILHWWPNRLNFKHWMKVRSASAVKLLFTSILQKACAFVLSFKCSKSISVIRNLNYNTWLITPLLWTLWYVSLSKVLVTDKQEKKQKLLYAYLNQRRHFSPFVVSTCGLIGRDGNRYCNFFSQECLKYWMSILKNMQLFHH